MMWHDAAGRAWEVVYLVAGQRLMSETTWYDATHRGWRSDSDHEHYRRLYEFRQGDDRSLNPDAIAAQFSRSHSTKTITQSVVEETSRRIAKDLKGDRAAAVQSVYDHGNGARRGLGRR